MRKQGMVTNYPWNATTLSGYNIENYELQPFRLFEGHLFKDGKPRFLHGQLWGLHVKDREEVERLFLLYGYTQLYSRNTCGFTMSRAARKRGYTTNDWLYLALTEHAKKRIAQ